MRGRLSNQLADDLRTPIAALQGAALFLEAVKHPLKEADLIGLASGR